MIVLGIDPGQTGGLVVVHKSASFRNPELLGAVMTPLANSTKKPTLDFAQAVHDIYAATTMIRDVENVHLAVIEQVHAMPSQGVASSFQFGRMYGAIEMLAQWVSDEQKYVTPQVWKKYFRIGKDKGEAVACATQFYGNDHWPLKKHEGVAEAALLATWGLHQLFKKEL